MVVSRQNREIRRRQTRAEKELDIVVARLFEVMKLLFERLNIRIFCFEVDFRDSLKKKLFKTKLRNAGIGNLSTKKQADGQVFYSCLNLDRFLWTGFFQRRSSDRDLKQD